MEIEGEDGTKLVLKAGVKVVFGRGSGFNTDDLTVSRRHVSLELSDSDRVSFEVFGRNPVWVREGEKGAKIRTFRKSETGEIFAGDQFCVSGNLPIWFSLKKRDEVMEERVSDGESELDSIDAIDPVKEFGFLVIGKEFDQYPKSRVRDIKQWEWFLEDSTKRNSDDDDDDDFEGDKKGKKLLGKKRRRKKGNEDDDWSVESDEDKELLVKSKGVISPTYSTRSKKTKKDTNASSSHVQTKQRGRVDVKEEEEEDDDEDDETLGGFIVSDEEVKLEEDDEEEEEQEEEDEDEDEKY